MDEIAVRLTGERHVFRIAPVWVDDTEPGWQFLRPMFAANDVKSEFYERRERRDLCAEEIKATLDLVWGGSGAVEKRTRLLVTERIFGIKSKESVAALSLDKL